MKILILISEIFFNFLSILKQFFTENNFIEKIFVKKCIKIGISKYIRVVACADAVGLSIGIAVNQQKQCA